MEANNVITTKSRALKKLYLSDDSSCSINIGKILMLIAGKKCRVLDILEHIDSSYGTIQSTLFRLDESGLVYVTGKDGSHTPRPYNIYALTAKGKRICKSWEKALGKGLASYEIPKDLIQLRVSALAAFNLLKAYPNANILAEFLGAEKKVIRLLVQRFQKRGLLEKNGSTVTQVFTPKGISLLEFSATAVKAESVAVKQAS